MVKIKKYKPEDFGASIVDKDLLNKDGSLKIRRGYKNKYKALDEKHGIVWYHAVYERMPLAVFGFTFVDDKHYQFGAFSAELNLKSNMLIARYSYEGVLLPKKKFLQKIEEHKIFFEWCVWNLG